MPDSIKLTQFSHGAGCGCKISPETLESILKTKQSNKHFSKLLVGNDTRDDAAVYDMDTGISVISTTDFFMPIVDDPFDFGRIAATNAISDVYAMGGRPIMAIAILGWPVNKLPPSVARQVIEGGRSVCNAAQIPLAGGHSIDSQEPIFGLSVTGTVNNAHIKLNSTAKPDDLLFLTKPLGIGILTTAQKQGKLCEADHHIATEIMCQLNDIGQRVALLEGVNAMTDVTGFGLLGHLSEMCEGSGVNAILNFEKVPRLNNINYYISENCVPGGSTRNFSSYGHKIAGLDNTSRKLLCDPQTSGGLLISVAPDAAHELSCLLKDAGLYHHAIGKILHNSSDKIISIS